MGERTRRLRVAWRATAAVGVSAWLTGVTAMDVTWGAQRPSASRSVRDGVYTEEQAERGAMQYRLVCEHCHLADLGGNPVEEAPSLVRDAFLARWKGKTARDLFDTLSKTMPADNPGTLSR